MLPPRVIRRLVLAPLVIVIACGFIVLSPFLALLALVFGLLARSRAGHMRSLRLVGFALVWFVAESLALVALTGLWVISGFGGRLRTEPYQSRHYAVMRRFLDGLYEGAEKTYGLRVEVEEPDLTGEELIARLTRPVIVFSRHAGPGDSFLLVHQLLSVYHRRPRVVMKAALQLDPSVDIVGNRLPNVWVKSRQVGEHLFTEQIARLARGLDARGALVIFPEGGNWTPGRWRRGIRRLEGLGRKDLAERAAQMPNLLPPRPGGALAAIEACPDADVIFLRATQESLSNVARHASATSVNVTFNCIDGLAMLTIEDNGRGFANVEETGERHFGLRGMRERVQRFGGRVLIDSEVGAGTSVTVALPLAGITMRQA